VYKVLALLMTLVLLHEGCSASGGKSTQPASLPQVEISRAITTTPGGEQHKFEGLVFRSGGLTLTILSPADGGIVTSSPIEVIVITNSEAVFTINGDLFILAAGMENTFLVSLVEGFNSIELVASDYEGNQVETILTVIYE
jgi:hypothetical protein